MGQQIFKLLSRNKTDNDSCNGKKWKKKGKTTVHNTLHIDLKTEQHEPHQPITVTLCVCDICVTISK